MTLRQLAIVDWNMSAQLIKKNDILTDRIVTYFFKCNSY
jgi:hypothetical protein